MLIVAVFVNIILVKNNMIQVPYYALLVLVIIPAINTVKIKNEMTPEIRRVHIFFIKIENFLRNKSKK
jgi:hypothetical protein